MNKSLKEKMSKLFTKDDLMTMMSKLFTKDDLMTMMSEFNRRYSVDYTSRPEAPEAGSIAWAVLMMVQGNNVRHTSWGSDDYLYVNGVQLNRWYGGDAQEVEEIMRLHSNDWEIYEAPKPIVECLPHEFVEGQEVLVRESPQYNWVRGIFKCLPYESHDKYIIHCERISGCLFSYCIPYADNEHLEGQITNGEHGAVPRGYVPPHVPKLGDEDYWQVGDETFCLVNGDGYVHDEDTGIDLKKPYTMCISLCGEMAHTWYDKYGKEDVQNYRTLFHRKAVKKLDNGKFEIDFNYAPTRPHKMVGSE